MSQLSIGQVAARLHALGARRRLTAARLRSVPAEELLRAQLIDSEQYCAILDAASLLEPDVAGNRRCGDEVRAPQLTESLRRAWADLGADQRELELIVESFSHGPSLRQDGAPQ